MREKNNRPLPAITGVVFVMFLLFSVAGASATQTSGEAAKFESYRDAIKSDFGIDIKEFKEQLKGGRADGKDIRKYDLKQILMGIGVEQEHTSNKMLALEITTDHLEEIPDYYTRLKEMEEAAEED